MAKRQSKRKDREDTLLKRRALYEKLVWVVTGIVSLLFGISYGYPIVAEGELARGILTGLAFGGGAFLVILVALFLNRKLKGL
jgi:uncharacterized membrane protein YfcA